MSSPNFERMKNLFLEASELEASRRVAFVREKCGRDTSLRDRLLRMLELDAQADPWDAAMPSRIGSYRIIARLGGGGMGAVFVAEQSSPSRRVALKVSLTPASNTAVQRFLYEAEVLATLQHPNIAQIIESAVDPSTGQPFFAMELVDDARTFVEYCEAHTLSSLRRLDLFLEIGEAVHYAHQKGIIHRDLKPENILVTSTGVPKILDFGIARARKPLAQAIAPHTVTGSVLGTLPYMSPEQALGDHGQVDVRSDVYALGVILYELLCGRLPYELEDRSLPEKVSIICETDPAPMRLANHRRLSDLEWITRKALEKDLDRRYQSARELLDDLVRFRRQETVLARRPSSLYRLSKFARRHRIALSLAFAVGIALCGAVFAVISGRLSAESRRLALLMTNAFEEILHAPDPTFGTPHDISVKELLDKNATAVLQTIKDDELRARFELAIGATYSGLGSYEQARSFLEQAKTRYTQLGALESDVADQVLIQLGRVQRLMGSYDDADSTFARALANKGQRTVAQQLSLRREMALLDRDRGNLDAALERCEELSEVCESEWGSSDPMTLRVRNDIASLLQKLGRLEHALAVCTDVVQNEQAFSGSQERVLLDAKLQRARILRDLGRYDEALAGHEDIWHLLAAQYGRDHPDTITARVNMATILHHRGDYDDALSIYRNCSAIQRRTLGEDHPHVLTLRNNEASALTGLMRFEEALEIHREVLEVQERRLGTEHPETLTSRHNVAQCLADTGKLSESLDWHRALVASMEDVYTANHPNTLMTRTNMATVLRNLGHVEDALSEHCAIYRARAASLGVEHPYTLNSRAQIALNLADLDRYREALTVYESVHEVRRRVLGDGHRMTLAAQQNIREMRDRYHAHLESIPMASDEHDAAFTEIRRVDLLRESGRLDEARILLETLLMNHGESSNEELLGLLYTQAGLIELAEDGLSEAEEFLSEALDLLRGTRGLESPETQLVVRDLANVHARLGNSDEEEVIRELLVHTWL